MPYLITFSNGATKTVNERPNIPPGGSVTRIDAPKPAAKQGSPAPAPVRAPQEKEG